MGFSAKQRQALKRDVDPKYIRTREAHGRELSYIEGWYAITEANRIFGFDGWNRETLESRCVLARENRGCFTAVYIAKVRISVQTKDRTVIREGHGSGEGRGTFPGDVHDMALKAAETDATKRALATFGSPFGLTLYNHGKATSASSPVAVQPSPSMTHPTVPTGTELRRGFHPDDTTPIPRPSRYYGRRDHPTSHGSRPSAQQSRTIPSMPDAAKRASEPTRAKDPQAAAVTGSTVSPTALPAMLPSVLPAPDLAPGPIDKSVLTIGEPKRLRDKAHLRFVASQPCLLCGRQPCDRHHLRFAQPRALGLKVSDEFTVPLCRIHHRQLHQAGNEAAWWEDLDVNALEIAKGLWEESHGRSQSSADTKPARAERDDSSSTQVSASTTPAKP